MGHLLRSAIKALFAQGVLHAELIKLEWAEEKYRLFLMVITLLAGAVFMLCTLLSLGAMALVFSWDTPYRNLVQVVITLVYGAGTFFAWLRFHQLAALGSQAFADTCAEIGADLALIRDKLGE